MKRLLDIVAAVCGLVVLAIPMLVIALLIRRDSPGEAIFRQRRAGRDGHPFTMLKFRTMRPDTEAFGQSPSAPDDPRLTKIGRFLRETSLDELPQLINILTGDMSLVGPRPLYEAQAARWNTRQRKRLDVRPGLTGYAQVFGRGKITHEEKLELDVYYVENRTLWLDARLVFLTLWNIIARRGDIYECRGHGG